jgi:hypothetical protein
MCSICGTFLVAFPPRGCGVSDNTRIGPVGIPACSEPSSVSSAKQVAAPNDDDDIDERTSDVEQSVRPARALHSAPHAAPGRANREAAPLPCILRKPRHALTLRMQLLPHRPLARRPRARAPRPCGRTGRPGAVRGPARRPAPAGGLPRAHALGQARARHAAGAHQERAGVDGRAERHRDRRGRRPALRRRRAGHRGRPGGAVGGHGRPRERGCAGGVGDAWAWCGLVVCCGCS